MPTANVSETVERVFKPIQQFTRGWMMSPETDRYGEEELGLKIRRQFWAVGRAGVLGSCPADVAVGAIAFVPAETVCQAWDNLPPGLSHMQVAEHYHSRIVAWGEDALVVFDPERMERLDAFGRRIIDAAPARRHSGLHQCPAPDRSGLRRADGFRGAVPRP